MSHECDNCGQEFETLNLLRLHDCSSAEKSARNPDDSTKSQEGRTDSVAIDSLDALLDDGTGGGAFLYQAMAAYESELVTASESDDSERCREIRGAYRKQLISELDETTKAEGWPILEEFIDAYHPDTSESFPHVTTILQNVIGRNLIRTRLADGVEAIPVGPLEYLETVRADVGEHQDYIIEGLHTYGWGIGHQELAVGGRIHEHATTRIFSASPMIEHAFYADQHAALSLLEEIVSDKSVLHEISRGFGDQITATRYLLDAPAGAASDYWPTIPRYWDWHEELAFDFELEPAVEQRIREIVRENGLDDDLQSDWEIADLTI